MDDYIAIPKKANVLDYIKKAVVENLDCKIYLTGNTARSLLDYARKYNALSEESEQVNSDVRILSFSFDDGFEKIDLKIKDDLTDRTKFQIMSFSSKGSTTFTYRVSKNTDKNMVQSKEVLIADSSYTKTAEPQKEI